MSATEILRPLKANSVPIPQWEPARSGISKRLTNATNGHYGSKRRLSRLQDITHDLMEDAEASNHQWSTPTPPNQMEYPNEWAINSDESSAGSPQSQNTHMAASSYQAQIPSLPMLGGLDCYSQGQTASPELLFDTVLQVQPGPEPNAQLEGFFHPSSPKVGWEEKTYLERKGAFTLPTLRLQNALLETFVEHVYPHLPIIHLQRFLHSVQNRDGAQGRVSLLLYQAIMFAASGFIEEEPLLEAGYTSRKEAQEVLYRRTRLLYDFDYESDRPTMVQILLLMTYWPGTKSDQKGSWYWMGAAISLATSLDLHLASSSRRTKSSEAKLSRRLWWSCFIRERLMAMGTKRPTRILDECCNAPMLDVDDFEVQAIPYDIHVLSDRLKLERTVQVQEDLAKIQIAKARLCLCMGGLLQASCRSLPQGSSTLRLLDHAQIQEIDQELTAWGSSLDECCRYHAITSFSLQNGQATVVLQRTLLQMLYYTTVCLLHRVQLSPGPLPFEWDRARQVSRLRVQDAAQHITRLSEELQEFDLVRLLPATVVVALLSAIVIHLTEMRDEVSQSKESAALRFEQCMGVMGELSRIHPAAEEEVQYLNDLLCKTNICRTR